MTTYNTGNPINSAAPRDLYDNSENFDVAVNSTSDTWTDRFGNTRRTLAGADNEFTQALINYQSQINDVVIAGGQIFPDVATGRAAVNDDAYYLTEGDTDDSATILWQRISSTSSRRVADNPSLDYVTMAVQMARDAQNVVAYPNVDYHLSYPAELTVDNDYNIIDTTTADGSVTTTRRNETGVTQYPNTGFADTQMRASVDAQGGIIEQASERQAFGEYTAYPYAEYAETGEVKQVALNGDIIDTPPRWGGRMHVTLDGVANDLFMVWPHGADKMLRVNYRPNGVNDLFNWRSTEIADAGDPVNASWETIASSNSDSWPPYIFEAVNNGDGGPQIYTGGNHSDDGGAGGVPTAYMSAIEFSVDGRKLRNGERFSGYADRVQVYWRNEIMAFNTITLERYPLTQEIRIECNPGDISGFVNATANEDIIMGQDNGPQMFSTGYDTFHYYDGEQQARLPIGTGTNTSGVFNQYPAWATVFGSAEYGFHGAWIDRDYETGDGRYISGSAGAFRKGSGGKFYSMVVGTGDVAFSAGDSYQYHAGYFWSPADAVSGDVDSVFTFHKRGVPVVGWSLVTGGDGLIDLPLWAQGSEVTGVGVDGMGGVPVSSSAYLTEQAQLFYGGAKPISSVDGLTEALDELNPQNNLDASAAPTATDDETDGYRQLSVWIFDGVIYRCIDATAGAAVWIDTGISASDLGTAAFEDAAAFDPSGSAASAQAFARQRTNHTGTQAIATVDGLQGALDNRVIYVDTVADLQALDTAGLVDGQAASVQGSEFRWGAGVAEWKPTGPVSVKAFGAVGDGVTDDTLSIQVALSSGITSLYSPPGEYLVRPSGSGSALTCATEGISIFGGGVYIVDQATRRLIEFTGENVIVQMSVNGNNLLADAIRVKGNGSVVEDCVIENLFSDFSDCTGISAFDVSGGVTIRNNRIKRLKGTLETEPFGRFTRAIQFYTTTNATTDSYIHSNYIEDVLGVEGDAIVVVALDTDNNRVDARVNINENNIKNFVRRAFKIQGYKVNIIGNYVTHTFESSSEMSTVRNVIDFVQCREGVIANNVLDGCKFCTQININEDGTWPVDNVVISGNSIFRIGSETPNSVMFISAHGKGLHIVNNFITVGTGRGIALNVVDQVNVSSNTFSVSESTNTAVITTTASSENVFIKGNSVFGGQRDCFSTVGSQTIIITDNFLNNNSAIYRGAGVVNESVVYGNINTGGGAYVGSIPGLKRGGNFLLQGTGANGDGLTLMYGTSPASFDNVSVREGQVVINVNAGEPLAWKATSGGLGSTVTWTALGGSV